MAQEARRGTQLVEHELASIPAPVRERTSGREQVGATPSEREGRPLGAFPVFAQEPRDGLGRGRLRRATAAPHALGEQEQEPFGSRPQPAKAALV